MNDYKAQIQITWQDGSKTPWMDITDAARQNFDAGIRNVKSGAFKSFQIKVVAA